jgi:hypothetical protein
MLVRSPSRTHATAVCTNNAAPIEDLWNFTSHPRQNQTFFTQLARGDGRSSMQTVSSPNEHLHFIGRNRPNIT